MNIPEVLDQFKSALWRVPGEYVTVAIMVLVALTSFGLGRLSVLETDTEQVRIIAPDDTVIDYGRAYQNSGKKPVVSSQLENSAANVNGGVGGGVVASKNGTKYHLPWCSGAKRIAEANKITFKSTEEAEKAGYTPAANCPGL